MENYEPAGCHDGRRATVEELFDIGDGVVIGADGVVTKDIPAGVLAAGNPCKAIREIIENDSIYLKAKRN